MEKGIDGCYDFIIFFFWIWFVGLKYNDWRIKNLYIIIIGGRIGKLFMNDVFKYIFEKRISFKLYVLIMYCFFK